MIRNEVGTAPGIWIEKDDKIFIVMPGVPFEMKAMMNNFIIPKLQEKIINKDFIVIRGNLISNRDTGIKFI